MKRRDERLDQRLGDFAPLRQPINEIHLERLLDRYGIALVCDYPQILFEHRDQMRLPGWWYRQNVPGYMGLGYDATPHAWPVQSLARSMPAIGDGRLGQQDALATLCEAYRVLDELFSPVRKVAGYPPSPSQQAYATSRRGGYL